MAGINKAIIIGNLGRDPEVSYTPGGMAIARFTIATSERWKDKGSGEWRDKTEWHRIVAFDKLAEICGEYLSKGRQVYIEGRIQTRDWEDKDGVKRYTTEIVAQQMQMLGPKEPGNTGRAAPQPSSGQAQPSDSGYQGQPPEDDIPF